MTRPYLTGRNTDYLCVFDLTDEWDGLTKYATFYNTHSQQTEVRLLSEGMCRIPYAVLTYGDVEVGVVGKNGKEAVKSSGRYTLPVEADAAEHDDEIVDPEGTVFEQIIAKLALLDRGIQSARIEDNNHLYIYLTNDERIDCGSVVSETAGQSIEFAFINSAGELILVRTNGEQVNCGQLGGAAFPEITAADEGKMLQIVDGAWVMVDPPVSLPAVTTLQNGQVLRVVDGAWQVTDADRTITSAYLNEDGELILVFNDGSGSGQASGSAVFPVITANDENKILKVVNGAWALVDLPSNTLPAVDVSDDGKILQVIDGAWQTVEADLSGGLPFAIGDGLKLENGVLKLDMADGLTANDNRPISASTVLTEVETVTQDAMDASAMTANDVDDLFDELFNS